MSELIEDMKSVRFNVIQLNERVRVTEDTFLNPSDHCKSEKASYFFGLMEVLGWGRDNISTLVGKPPKKDKKDESEKGRDKKATTTEQPKENFSFQWSSQGDKYPEVDSYEDVITFLKSLNISAIIVGNGKGLPGGYLFDAPIHTLKPNTTISSLELKNRSKQPYLRYTIRGRTDILVKYDPKKPPGHRNTKYLIEIKTAYDFRLESALREAVLQLVGCNASNTFHSPPVILTNLAGKHYVLFVVLEGDPKINLSFSLKVYEMETFREAVDYAEELSQRECVTSHFCRPSSAPPSPPLASPEKPGDKDAGEDDDEVYNNAQLSPVNAGDQDDDDVPDLEVIA